MSFEKRPQATATFEDSTPLDISDGSVTLDSGKAPYALADIEVPLLDEAILEDLDPYANQRVLITASADGSWSPGEVGYGYGGYGEEGYGEGPEFAEPVWTAEDERQFDLVLTCRTVSHDRRSVALDLASDEAILQRYADVSDDPAPRTHEASLRSLVGYVLDKAIPGAALEAGPDADVTAYWPVTNLCVNPSFEVDIAGWTNGTNASGAAVYAKAYSGSSCIHWNQAAAGDSWIDGQSVGARPGATYVLSAYLTMIAGAAGTGGVMLRFWNDAATILADCPGAMVATGSGWTRAHVIATAPPGATRVSFHVRHNGAGGRFPGFDAVLFHEGDELVPYFDGSTADTAAYVHEWSGAAHATTSTRTPVISRPREMLTWEAGVSAWDFLAPIVATSGCRLWCDEQRRWWLIDPAEYSIPGRVVAQISNTSRGEDAIDSLSPLYATGVVLVYTWTDAEGVAQRRVDAAGTGPYVKREEINRPYPGPGRAAARLLKLQGQGRTQDVTVGADYSVTPAMEIGIRLPGTFDQLGTLQGVTWRLKEGVMDLASIGLTSTIPGTIAALDGTIDGLTGTIDSI